MVDLFPSSGKEAQQTKQRYQKWNADLSAGRKGVA